MHVFISTEFAYTGETVGVSFQMTQHFKKGRQEFAGRVLFVPNCPI